MAKIGEGEWEVQVSSYDDMLSSYDRMSKS